MTDAFDLEAQAKTNIEATYEGLPKAVKSIPIMCGITILILLTMGRELYCSLHTHETHIAVFSTSIEHMSQHLFDPYSITHMMHGVLMYNSFRLAAKYRLHDQMAYNLALTVLCSCVWELVENTSLVIDMYRTNALHYSYYGDSVTNSIGDIISCILGWLISYGIGTYMSALLFIASECLLIVWINDNLTKNVIMLFKLSHVAAVLVFLVCWIIKIVIEALIGYMALHMISERVVLNWSTCRKKCKVH